MPSLLGTPLRFGLVLVLFNAGFIVAVEGRAAAHALWKDPLPRDDTDGYKPTRSSGFVLPCGVARSAAQPVTRIAMPDLTRTVRWTETVNHPGCFLIEFAASDDAPFQLLKVIKHVGTGGTPRPYQTEVSLPAEPCSGCVLRLRQVMLGSESATCPPPGLEDLNPDLYYSCANLEISASQDGGPPPPPDPPDASTPGGGGGSSGSTSGCSVVGGRTGSAGDALILMAVALGWVWRRRWI